MRVLLFITILLVGCKNSPPSQEDIVGIWTNSDGAEFKFNKDGTFIGKNLPAIYFVFHTSRRELLGIKIDGFGNWKIEKGQTRWRIYLDFKEPTTENNPGGSILLLSRTGNFETGDSWYIFRWEEEEGGNRYIFEKKYK